MCEIYGFFIIIRVRAMSTQLAEFHVMVPSAATTEQRRKNAGLDGTAGDDQRVVEDLEARIS
jgi:hypothetical protein